MTQHWIITDTHFYHMKMCEYENRPSDFTERIIANWQRLVKPDDTVIHLGDVILGKNGTLGEILARLPGRKILTMGNHDHGSVNWYLKKGFSIVRDDEYYLCWHGLDLVFSHEPLVPIPECADYNIHGHFHCNPVRLLQAEQDEYYRENRERYRLVQIEETFAPVRLRDVLCGNALRGNSASGSGTPTTA